MWILRAKFFDENNKLSQILRKTNVNVFYYPSNHYIKNNRYYFVAIALIQGNEKAKKDYFNELKKLKKAKIGRRLEFLEIESDFFILITSHSINKESKLFVSSAYDITLTHYRPVVWDSDGWEEWSVASIDRKALTKLIKIGEEIYKIKILEFKQRKVKNFGFLTILPELTKRQKQALELAIKEGYYSYPRKTDLKTLAKRFGVAFSAFQGHIRKTENKIMNALFSK